MNIYRLWWDRDYTNVPEELEADGYRFIRTIKDNYDSEKIEFYKGDDVVATFHRYPIGISLVRTT